MPANNRHKRRLQHLTMAFLFPLCGTLAFVLGLNSVNDMDPIISTEAQAAATTKINVLLQYQPVSGGAPQPIEVTPFMNGSETPLLSLQEIHTGHIVPFAAQDKCRTTNSLGRCSISTVPVGPDTENGLLANQQYDILLDTVFLEFLTAIALEPTNAHVRFDQNLCSGGNTSFSDGKWCLTKPGGSFPLEYFVTITLQERDDCLAVPPPASLCTEQNELVSFSCNPSFVGSSRPWEPETNRCPSVRCFDGNLATGVCAEITSDFAACSTSASCVDHPLCTVSQLESGQTYDAGSDTLVLRGEHFGSAGGTVSFPTENAKREVVEIASGADWHHQEIHVRIPRAAVSGILQIHPNTHGSVEENGTSVPVSCDSPLVTMRSLKDQFSILALSARSAEGVRRVAPGFTTTLEAAVQHNDRIDRLQNVMVELLEGGFPDQNMVPINRRVLAQSSCPALPTPDGAVREGSLTCDIAIPAGIQVEKSPFTFLVTIIDDVGNVERATLVDAGTSVLAGDFSGDGMLTIADAVLARRIATGELSATSVQLLRDTDGDQQISMNDVLFILHSLTAS